MTDCDYFAKPPNRLRFAFPRKAPHCGALWAGRGRLRLRPFILCFNRTGKQGATISETGHGREGNTHPKRLSSSSSERYSPGLFIHRPQPPQRSFQGAAAGTHATQAPNRAHSGLHGETGAFRTGVVSLPSERFARFGNPVWPGVRTAYFAAFWPWPGALEEHRKPAGQRCVHARRCPEASRPRWAA